ncbi:hypothetical protein ABIC94_003034 [Variovorax paradoxus]|uniref:hypothetical protein n=1 Tax=Variovorax paradoxus TaxID=34073 RepID=UPI003398F70D
MMSYLMYGYANGIQSAKLKIESAFQVHFEERHSSYWGNYFLYGSVSQLLLEIKKNIDQIDGEALERQFPQYPTLLYISAPDDFSVIANKLPHEFLLLRKEIF